MKKLKIVEKKLGRARPEGSPDMRVWDQYKEEDNLIEIDERMPPRQKFKILIHELLHFSYPNLSEKDVIHGALVISKNLWEQGYRKVNQ